MTSEPNSSSASSDSFRDEGLAAFQRQDLPTAQAKLMTAIQQNPQDGMAFLYLGGVYHQMGQSEEALQALHRAVQLMPQQPQVRYNLGIVQEKLGQNAEAFASYQQAVALQPNYPLAQQGMQRLQGAAAPAPVVNGVAPSLYSNPAPAVPTMPTVPPMPTVPAMPAQPPYQSGPGYAPVAPAPYALNQQQPAPTYAPAPPSYGQPVATDLAGNPLPAAQPTYAPTPVGAPPGSAYAPPGPAGYRGQQWTPYATEAMTKEDSFDIPQAFKDLGRILVSPGSFFAEEEGASGQGAPNAMLLVLAIVLSIGSLINAFRGVGQSPIFILLGIPFLWGIFIVTNYVLSGVIYGLSRLFGGSGSYTGAYRACVYGWAPYTVMTVLAVLVGLVLSPTPAPSASTNPFATGAFNQQSTMQPGGFPSSRMRRPGTNPFSNQTSESPFGTTGSSPSTTNPFMEGFKKGSAGTSNPVSMLLTFGGFVWGLVVLGMGLKATQRISTGAAVGVAILQMVVWVGLLLVIGVVLGAALAGIMATAHH